MNNLLLIAGILVQLSLTFAMENVPFERVEGTKPIPEARLNQLVRAFEKAKELLRAKKLTLADVNTAFAIKPETKLETTGLPVDGNESDNFRINLMKFAGLTKAATIEDVDKFMLVLDGIRAQQK